MFPLVRPALAQLSAAFALILVLAAPALADKPGAVTNTRGGGPAVQTINGAPLTINVGDDHSFQIFNADIPGVGQIYPSDSTGTADMGWMVRLNGTLYSPDYSSHSGTATSGLGSYTPYQARSVSAVTGAGTTASPFEIVVQGQLGSTGWLSREVVQYVNGDNYFTKRLTLTNTADGPSTASIFLGGDIYLAGDDSGIPYRQAASGSIGGSDCVAPASYYILYIPQTPADGYTGAGYANVWSQIGAGMLSNSLTSASCIDNGAALQWNRTVEAGDSVTIQATTSFGEIPSIILFDVTNVVPNNGEQGSSVNVTISGLGFAPGMQLDFGAGIALSNLVVVNGTTATATLNIAGNAAVGLRDVRGTSADGSLTDTLVGGFNVTGSGGPLPTGPRPVPSLDGLGLIALLLGLFVIGLVAVRRHG